MYKVVICFNRYNLEAKDYKMEFNFKQLLVLVSLIKLITELRVGNEVKDEPALHRTGSSFWKNLQSRNGLKFTNHLGNHCLFHA